MGDSAFFKVKSTKRSNPEARTTLDAIHHEKIQSMMEQKKNIHILQEEIEKRQKKIQDSNSDVEIWKWEREIEQLEKRVKNIEDGTDLMDYYLRTGDILYNYYDIQDQINQGTNILQGRMSYKRDFSAISYSMIIFKWRIQVWLVTQ